MNYIWPASLIPHLVIQASELDFSFQCNSSEHQIALNCRQACLLQATRGLNGQWYSVPEYELVALLHTLDKVDNCSYQTMQELL